MRILLLELEKKLEIAALEKGDKKLIGELEIKLQIAKKLRNISDDPATLLESFKRALPSLHYTALLKDQVEPTLLSFRNESGALDKEKIFRQFERDLRGLATLTIKGIPPNANLTKLIKHHYNETAHDQLIASYREDFFAYLTDYFAKQAKSDFTTKIEQKALKIMGLMQQGSLGEIHHEIAKAALPLTYGQEVNDFFAMPKKEFELHMPHSETALKPFKHSFLLPQRPLTAKSPEDSKAYSAEYDLIENTITYNKEMQVMLEGEPIPSFPRIRCVALLDIENENLNITIGSKNQESLMHYLLTGKWLFS